MLQRSPLASVAAPAELADTWRRTGNRAWLDLVRQVLVLPNSARSFANFLLLLAIVSGGLAMQVFLSVDIMESRIRLAELRSDLDLIEQQNAELIWQIAQVDDLNELRVEAARRGFEPITERHYVVRTEQGLRPLNVVRAEEDAARIAAANARLAQQDRRDVPRTGDPSAPVVTDAASQLGELGSTARADIQSRWDQLGRRLGALYDGVRMRLEALNQGWSARGVESDAPAME